MTRAPEGGPRAWELRLYRLCLRACPRDLRGSVGDGMYQTFVDRRATARMEGIQGVADTLLECLDVLRACLVLRAGVGAGRDGGSGATPTGRLHIRGSRSGRGGTVREGLRGMASVVRLLARRPAWALLVVATLGAGIGATTAVFSVVDAVTLRALPYRSPGDLIRIGGVREGRPGLASVSGPNFRDLEASATLLSQVAASTPSSIAVGGIEGPADQIRGGYVSGGFFPLLGARAARGRTLLPGDDRPGAPAVAVLGHGLAEQRFGADVVGTTLLLDGRPVTVVGVMGPDFHPPEGAHLGETLLWLPLSHAPLPVDERGLSFLDVLGRLAHGVTPARADAELFALGTGLRESHRLSPRQFSTFASRPLAAETVGDAGVTLRLLLGAVVLLLAVACANVANLILVRTLDRGTEVAVRVSLGASRARILRDVVFEALVLALSGGALGVALAYAGVEALKRTAPIDLPRLQEVTVDGRILLFAVGLSLAVGLVVGLLPAVRSLGGGTLSAVVGGGRRSSGTRRQGRLRDALVVGQAAVGLILLLGAGLLLNSLVRLHRVDPGFQTGGLHVLSVRLPDGAGGPGAATDVHDAILAAVAGVPGVRRATATTGAPFTSGGWTVYVQPEGSDIPEEELAAARIGLHHVSGGHLSNMGMRLVSGREILDTDVAGSEPVVIVSATLADAYWPDGGALGSSLVVGGDGTFTQRTIVGVVETALYQGPGSRGEQHVYLPYHQFPPASLDVMIRSDGLGAETVAGVRAAVFEAAPGASIRRFESVDAAMARYLVEPGFYAWLLTVFAAIALFLAAGGLYGTLAFAVGERRREFGIRIALGADGPSLVRGVVGRGLAITGLGVAMGLAGSLAAGRVLASHLYQLSATDAATYITVCATFVLVASAASWIPARRAARTEPVESLRDP